jgi:pimeloyl-ACP methyl ester carboxylesterase
MLCDWGYAALRFDFRGCGDSGGQKGYVLCMDQVADTRNALTWLAQRPEIDDKRIAVMGHSFGAAVAIHTGGTDERVAAVVSSCGWGNGERKFRGQHPGAENWKKFTDMLARGREHKAKTGEPLWVSRWDVVPIPEHLRRNLPSKAQMQVTADTAQSMYDFAAENVVDKIAPRPLMLLHTADDQVTPTEQSLRLFERAKMPTELYLITGESHFPLAGDGKPARDIIKGWLDRFFPLHR